MVWFKDVITKDIATRVMNELVESSKVIIARKIEEAKHLKFTSSYINKNFAPCGAIVDITKTASIWDYVRAMHNERIASHFIISRRPYIIKNQDYLTNHLPVTVLVPTCYDKFLNHAGYISSITWGITLQLNGRLRPYYSPFTEDKPTPLFSTEETDKHFIWESEKKPKLYSSKNLWRTPYKHMTYQWINNMFYDVPTFDQIKTLIILLRVLNALSPIDQKFIMPANCINFGPPTIPILDWDTIRDLVFSQRNISLDEMKTKIGNRPIELDTTKSVDGSWEKSEFSDEAQTNIIVSRHTWKNELDDKGKLAFLLKEIDEEAIGIYNFRKMGYDTHDTKFILRAFCNATNNKPTNLKNMSILAAKKWDTFSYKKIKPMQEFKGAK